MFRYISEFACKRSISLFVVLVGALLIMPVTDAAGSAKVSTDQELYPPEDSITVLFAGGPANKTDFIVVVQEDAPAAGPFRRTRRIRGKAAGSVTFRGLPPGQYEARLMPGRAREQIAARDTFAVEDDNPATTGSQRAQTQSNTVPTSAKAAASEAPASAGGPALTMVKPVYAPRKEIEVRFSNAPGGRRDLIAIARYGWTDKRQTSRKALKGETTGIVTLRGQRPGRYEARLYRDRTEVVARALFVVGGSCLEPPDDGSFCDFGVRLSKETYRPGAQIEVSFEGGTGNGHDRLVLVRKNSDGSLSPLGDRAYAQRVKRGEMTGSHTFYGLPEGSYEAQLLWRMNAREDEKIAARTVFTVDDGKKSAPPAGPHIVTQKKAYAPEEAIIATFTNAPGHRGDRVTIAKPGMTDRQQLARARLSGALAGKVELRGRKAGRYEARLVAGETRAIVARHTFVVGQSCAEAPPDGAGFCEPAIRTKKKQYAAGEPIEVVFEGAPGNHFDWLTIVQKTGEGQYRSPSNTQVSSHAAPDGEQKPWMRLAKAMTGSHVFEGLDEGTYEVQLYVKTNNRGIGKIKARSAFTVGGEKEKPFLALQELYGEKDAAEKPAAKGSTPAGRSQTVEQRMRADRPGTAEQLSKSSSRESRRAGDHSKTAPAPGATDIVPFEAALPEPGVAGSWLAHITCTGSTLMRRDAPRTERALLRIEGQQALRAKFFLVRGDSDGFGLTMAGEFDRAGQTVSLSPEEWVYDAGREQAPRLKARLDQTGVRMEGELENAANGCAAFRAVKFMPDDRPTYSRGLVPQWEKSQRALAHEATCVPLLKWVRNGRIVESQDFEIPSQILDTNAFYRVMGKPYDLWTDSDGTAFRQLHSMCRGMLRRSRDVSLSSLSQGTRENREALSKFLRIGAPSDTRRFSYRDHLRFLSNYAQVVAVRNARLYKELALKEMESLSDREDSIGEIAAAISDVDNRRGVFAALSDETRKAAIVALTTVKDNMSGRLIEKAFKAFPISGYERSLDGLKRARADRESVISIAARYGTDAQLAGLKENFDTAFAPFSKTVADDIIASISEIEGSVDGFLQGKRQKEQMEQEVVPHLVPVDQDRLISALEARNAEAVRQLLPAFRQWLTDNISPDRNGRSALETFSVATLGVRPQAIKPRSFSAPYDGLAMALLDRAELLNYQICELPTGFEELRAIVCGEPAVSVAKKHAATKD